MTADCLYCQFKRAIEEMIELDRLAGMTGSWPDSLSPQARLQISRDLRRIRNRMFDMCADVQAARADRRGLAPAVE